MVTELSVLLLVTRICVLRKIKKVAGATSAPVTIVTLLDQKQRHDIGRVRHGNMAALSKLVKPITNNVSDFLKSLSDKYVYHSGSFKDEGSFKSVAEKGLVPSEGKDSSGVYMAYSPDGTYYHVSPEEATTFRAPISPILEDYGLYKDTPSGVQYDAEELIVPGAVRPDLLEVKVGDRYFPVSQVNEVVQKVGLPTAKQLIGNVD